MRIINQEIFSSNCSAAIAQSSPLLPNFPPDRSIACCMFRSVNTQNKNGMSNKIFKSLIPSEIDWAIISKWGVSPFMILPITITASNLDCSNIFLLP